MSVARFYVADKNPEGASFPGVPLADIDEAEWDRYPAWLQRSVDASELYRKTRPEPVRRAAPVKRDEETG